MGSRSKKRPKISWLPFYDQSRYRLVEVRSVCVVGLKGKTLTPAPAEPGEPAYLLAGLQMSASGDSEGRRGFAPNRVRFVFVIVDEANDRWQYVRRAGPPHNSIGPLRVANWPPRYRLTQQMRIQIATTIQSGQGLLAADPWVNIYEDHA